MKAAFMKKGTGVEVREIPDPLVEPHEVKIRVEACGICGSDLQALTQHADQWTRFGHEFGGVVIETGEAVTRFCIGDRVIWNPVLPCGRCLACLRGETISCRRQIGAPGGGCAEVYVAGEEWWVPAQDLTALQLALAEPLTVAIDLVEEGRIPVGGVVGVIGVGPIGLMTVKLALLRGACRVIAVDRADAKARLAAAERLGAGETITGDASSVLQAVKKLVPDGLDTVLVTAPPGALPLALDLCAFGATVALIGTAWDGSQRIEIDVNQFHFRNIRIQGANNCPVLRFPVAIDLMQRGIIEAGAMFSHTFALDEVNEAFRVAVQHPEQVLKLAVVLNV